MLPAPPLPTPAAAVRLSPDATEDVPEDAAEDAADGIDANGLPFACAYSGITSGRCALICCMRFSLAGCVESHCGGEPWAACCIFFHREIPASGLKPARAASSNPTASASVSSSRE